MVDRGKFLSKDMSGYWGLLEMYGTVGYWQEGMKYVPVVTTEITQVTVDHDQVWFLKLKNKLKDINQNQ